MSRSRPTIDVSSHLIEPAAAPARSAGAVPVPIDWVAMFGNDRPVELEVGSGKGLFLANAARANPGRNFLGVEISRKYARLAAERLARQGSPTPRSGRATPRRPGAGSRIGASARCTSTSPTRGGRSGTRSAASSPTPWWPRSSACSQPGGELHVASDVEEYFDLIRELVAASPRSASGRPPRPRTRARARLPDQLRAEVPPGRAADPSRDLRLPAGDQPARRRASSRRGGSVPRSGRGPGRSSWDTGP